MSKIPSTHKCRECGTHYGGDLVPDKCFWCDKDGTIVELEPPKPTAIAGTDSARRCAEGASEAVVDGAAPLCDGPEELKRAAAVIQREVQRRMAKLWMPGCFKEIARLRILDAALVELLPDDYAETAGGPAQSV